MVHRTANPEPALISGDISGAMKPGRWGFLLVWNIYAAVNVKQYDDITKLSHIRMLLAVVAKVLLRSVK